MKVVCDIETDALLNPKHIWVAVCQDCESGDVRVFRENDRDAFADYAARVSTWIGHNFLTYDRPVIKDLWGVDIDPKKIIDTLVVGRLVYYAIPGGHSLDNWGRMFKYAKSTFSDFSEWSRELEERCVVDVEINTKVWQFLRKYIEDPEWRVPLRIEHDTALAMAEMNKVGFYFDKERADEFYKELLTKRDTLEQALRRDFPPQSALVKEVTPRATKHGTLHRQDFRWLGDSPVLSGYAPGVPFSVFKMVPFNPGSPTQVVERLNEAGWKPIEPTQSGKSWRISETNLETLPDDAPQSARHLVEWLLVAARVRRLEEWFKAYRNDTHRIHGQVTHIGCWTQRCAHRAPNMGNVPSLYSKYSGEDLKQLAYEYGKVLRGLWAASPGKKLVGCDAEGIQLRLFAHYIDEPAFTTALVSGNQEDGTDAHSLNAQALGEGVSRAAAKTFIYSFILGAGVGKAAGILNVPMGEAAKRRDGFIARYPGLKYLREEVIPQDVARGYFIGLDGRKVHIPENKREGNVAGYILGGYLQNGESIIMKWAMQQWKERLRERQIDATLVNFIHDEWQTETEECWAETVGKVQAQAIADATERFNLKCPMAGSFKVGNNWFETH